MSLCLFILFSPVTVDIATAETVFACFRETCVFSVFLQFIASLFC